MSAAPCKSPAMPELDIRSVGNGPRQTATWLDGTPCMVTGLIGATYHIVTLQAGESHLNSFRQTTSHHNVMK